MVIQPNQHLYPVTIWLGMMCGSLFGLILLGAAVRLTGSGLSMVEWRPISGIIPPLNLADWQRIFTAYQQFPEFQLTNPDMTLGEFRFIFWLEYAHRMLARAVGIIFFMPLIFFICKRMLTRALIIKLSIIFFAGALQGIIGWYMVQSGLSDNANVSHYRLTLHFMLAVFIYAYLFHLFTGQLFSVSNIRPAVNMQIPISDKITLFLILLMMTSGALVAGSKAGYIYNTWPQMGKFWLPPQLFALQPMWLNLVENPITIQFMHRYFAMIVAIAVIYIAIIRIRTRQNIGQILLGIGLLIAIIGQILLGITALLLQVPTAIGIAHQGGGLILLSLIIIAITYRPRQFIG